MKKNYLLIILLFLINPFMVVGEETDSSKAKIIVPAIGELLVGDDVDSVFNINITIIRPLKISETKDVLLKIEKDVDSFEDSKYLTIFNQQLLITKAELESRDTVIKTIHIKSALDSTFVINENKLAKIIIAPYDTNTKVIIENDVCIIKSVTSFRSFKARDGVNFSLGTNLDLADGADPLSFYGRLGFYDPIIFDTSSKVFDCWFTRLFRKAGVYGAVYQNKFISDVSTTPAMQYYNVLSIFEDDSLGVNRTFGNQKTTVSYNNYGLQLSLPFTVSASTSNPKHRRYFSVTPIDFEVLLRKATTSYTYDNSQSDIIKIHKDSLTNKNLIRNNEEQEFVDKYWGLVNLQYSMSGEIYRVFIKATPFGMYWHDNISAKYVFYSFYMSITEKNFGLTVGGEFKGVYSKGNPYFNLFVTKAFNLSKLGEALRVSE